MKTKDLFKFFVLPIIFIALSSSSKADIPNELYCQKISCTDIEKPLGNGTWCDPNSFNSVTIQSLGYTKRPLLKFSNGDSILGELRSNHSEITLDFSDGDQYTTILLQEAGLIALQEGKTNSIFAVYKDAYGWSDGEHTRFIIQLNCFTQPTTFLNK